MMSSPLLHLLVLFVLFASVISSARAQAAVYVDSPPTLVAAIAAIDNNTDGRLSEATPALFGFTHQKSIASFNGSLVWAGDGLMTNGSNATTGCDLSSNATFNYSTNPIWRQLVDEMHVESVILMIQRGGCAFDQKILHAQLSNALVTVVLIIDPAALTPIYMNDAGLGATITIASFFVYGPTASTLLTYWQETHPNAGETELTMIYGADCAAGILCASSSSSSTGAGILPSTESSGGLSAGTVAGIVVVCVVTVTAVAIAAHFLLRRRLDSARNVRREGPQEFVNLA